MGFRRLRRNRDGMLEDPQRVVAAALGNTDGAKVKQCRKAIRIPGEDAFVCLCCRIELTLQMQGKTLLNVWLSGVLDEIHARSGRCGCGGDSRIGLVAWQDSTVNQPFRLDLRPDDLERL